MSRTEIGTADPVGLDARLVVRRQAFTLDVTLTAAPGEVVAVLGPNGSGKSTVLGALAGLIRPDEGWVLSLIHI